MMRAVQEWCDSEAVGFGFGRGSLAGCLWYRYTCAEYSTTTRAKQDECVAVYSSANTGVSEGISKGMGDRFSKRYQNNNFAKNR